MSRYDVSVLFTIKKTIKDKLWIPIGCGKRLWRNEFNSIDAYVDSNQFNNTNWEYISENYENISYDAINVFKDKITIYKHCVENIYIGVRKFPTTFNYFRHLLNNRLEFVNKFLITEDFTDKFVFLITSHKAKPGYDYLSYFSKTGGRHKFSIPDDAFFKLAKEPQPYYFFNEDTTLREAKLNYHIIQKWITVNKFGRIKPLKRLVHKALWHPTTGFIPRREYNNYLKLAAAFE